MQCPKCSSDTLQEFGQVEGVVVDFCSGCKGIWFDQGELAFYVEAHTDVPRMEESLAAGKAIEGTCPRCTVPLVETHYIPDDPLLIDICPKCNGIFLDKGEVPKVEAMAASRGGVGRVMRTAQALEEKGYQVLGAGVSKS